MLLDLLGITTADDEWVGQLEATEVGHTQIWAAGDPPIDQVGDRPRASCPKPWADMSAW